MKKIFRFLSGMSMFFGVLFVLSGIYSTIMSFFSDEIGNLPLFLFAMLFMVAVGVGLIYLGYRLFLRSGNKTKAVTPETPAPLKPTADEHKRQEFDAEECKRQWKEAEEERKRARAEYLKPWQGIDPAYVENIKLWEDSLEKDCALSIHYIFRGQGDDGLDGTYDYTGVDWFLLHINSDLKKVIQLYAQIDTYRKSCEAGNHRTSPTENRILRSLMSFYRDQRVFLLPSEEQFEALGEDKESCMTLCREHGLMIMRSEGNCRYYNYVNGINYTVYVGATFPGSADDAATYGALYLGAF